MNRVRKRKLLWERWAPRRYLCLLLALLASFLIFSGNARASGLRLSKTSVELEVGKTSGLMLKNCKKPVKWSVSNKKVTLKRLAGNKVKLTAVEEGTAVVTAKAGKKKYTCRVKINDRTFRYLALGNSITIHPKCSFWWTECGMAASTADKDYVHQVTAGLQKKYPSVKMEAVTLGNWEIQNVNRPRILKGLDEVLKTGWDLITVQIGDNIRSLYGFEKDFGQLLKYIKEKNPRAKVVVIGNFWKDLAVLVQSEKIKRKAASKYGALYADIAAIANKSAYQRGMGATVYDASGNAHKVWVTGVARHPNDKGMACIAKKVLELL